MNLTEKVAPGAPPAAGFVPLIVPEIRGNEWKYVKECLDTAWVSSVGAFVDRFEELVAERVGARYGIATVNGTAALHIALLIAGVERDDEVLVSTLTFIAPANAIRYVGAWPVFIDADTDFWQMDPAKVADFLRQDCRQEGGALFNRHTGRRVTAIVPVHVLGHPVDMDPILELAQKYGLKVIEDSTESLGAAYKGRSVGSLGHLACFSFNGNKLITTGGGGMIVTDNEAWARKARYLTTQAKDDPVEYIHHAIGYNYRLTNLQAAIGCGQMEQLDAYITAKRAIAKRYAEGLGGLPGITCMQQAPWAASAYWMYTVLIDRDRFGLDSRGLMRELNVRRIQTRPLWRPIHQSRAHQHIGASQMPVAERLHKDCLSLPCSVGLSKAEQDRVIHEITEITRSQAVC